MQFSRRQFLGWGSTIATGALGFQHFAVARTEHNRYGKLIDDPLGMLNLPAGFSYRVLAQTGDRMSDGAQRRDLPDGMAAFPGALGQVILMCNHERYENGGVSRLVVDQKTLRVLSSNDVLTGTQRNCSGGPSPWGWLSCEEITLGGVWLCPTGTGRALGPSERRRIDAYGSFCHEAVCIDPERLIAYLTEDDGPSYIYRMVPIDRKHPFVGQLQALRARTPAGQDTSEMRVGDGFDVGWVNVEAKQARASAQSKGATVFQRGEGIWFFDGAVYFTCTSNDQLFKLTPQGEGGRVELIANDFSSPDNITVSPRGEVVVAEDQKGRCRLRVLDVQGKVSTLAQNALGIAQEFAGVCFSPDGSTLFCNLQKSGHTVAIQGPF
jgi:uncharacterized protein